MDPPIWVVAVTWIGKFWCFPRLASFLRRAISLSNKVNKCQSVPDPLDGAMYIPGLST